MGTSIESRNRSLKCPFRNGLTHAGLVTEEPNNSAVATGELVCVKAEGRGIMATPITPNGK